MKMTGKIQIMVKSANQAATSDHLMEECDPNWTVLQLKEFIKDTHPSNPNVGEQRLIYSGQLLSDKSTLQTVLRHPPENDTYTVHLVYPLITSVKNSHAPLPQKTGPVHSASHAEVRENEALRRRQVTTEASVQQESFGSTATYTPVGLSIQDGGDPAQQMASVQQIYAQYMATYMDYIQTSGICSSPGGFVWPQQMVTLPNNITGMATDCAVAGASESGMSFQSNGTAPPEIPVPPTPARQQDPPPRMNAQGEVEEDDDEGVARDWLDYLYHGSQISILLSFVFFYSTLSKFMLVGCISMLIYLYQAGWFRPSRRHGNPAQEDAPQDGHNDANHLDDDRNNNVENNNNNNELPPEIAANNRAQVVPEDAGRPNAAAAAPAHASDDLPQPHSLLALVWMFLTNLFTSLVPEQPQVI